jgi:hypothetical protein
MAMLNHIAAVMDKRVEIRFVPARGRSLRKPALA